MNIQYYIYGLLIAGILTISPFLTGSSVNAEQTSRDTLPPENIDTMLIKRLVKEKVTAMIEQQVDKVDSIRDNLIDSANEVQRSLPAIRLKHWKRYVDLEKRPHKNKDNTISERIYKWTWWYWIQKQGVYKDTVWDKVQVERIQ